MLARYAKPGNYADCLTIEVAGTVALQRFAASFLTCRAFRLERLLLTLIRVPSTDAEAAQLAAGEIERFAAWTAEAREADQLMLCDYQSRTRSWLRVEPLGDATRLWFGTAVTRPDPSGPRRALAAALFWVLLPFHKVYARMLLRSAASCLIA